MPLHARSMKPVDRCSYYVTSAMLHCGCERICQGRLSRRGPAVDRYADRMRQAQLANALNDILNRWLVGGHPKSLFAGSQCLQWVESRHYANVCFRWKEDIVVIGSLKVK